ncbi:hypothetical protein UFOVP280_29 [uncultured Caudovirales phage]|uniref:Uncharacterized protein n=1 Tax=uncultured Caudovirales phage TaxID=2100421 RepID=A0A6J5LNW4_9CAUD|nr:hypothetical protein UFOVP280_29 [uncultured Caudovirales phage]
MKLQWEKGVNHNKEAENMMRKAEKYKFTPVQMIEIFILNELNIELDQTKTLFLEMVFNHENNLMNEMYNKGVTKVFEELNEKMDELAEIFN